MIDAQPQPEKQTVIPPSRKASGWPPLLLLGLALITIVIGRGMGWPLPARFAWLTGTPVIASILGLIALVVLTVYNGHIIHFFLQRIPPPDGLSEDELAMRRALVRATQRYKGTSPWLYCYAVIKYRSDPCYIELARRIPAGKFLVDLGTGLGMLPLALAERDGAVRALGIEWDAAKAHGARFATQDIPGIEIRCGDIWKEELPGCDVITLIDVLHYHPVERQHELLVRAAAALGPGGELLIREVDARDAAVSRRIRRTERTMVFFGWNRSDSIHFRTAQELTGELQSLGFTVEQIVLDNRFMPGNILLSAVKK